MSEPRETGVKGLRDARSLMLYLLSFSSVAHAVLAWDPRGGGLALAGWAVLLALALLAGDAVAPRLGAMEPGRRLRARVAATTAYLGLVAVAIPIALVAPDLRLLGTEAALFALVQPGFLLFSGVGRGDVGALGNALVLTALAALRGGPVAAGATLAYVGLLGYFLAFDRFARALAVHPTARGPFLGVAFRDASTVVLPVVIVLGAFLAALPPAPHRGMPVGEMTPEVREATANAYRLLGLLALVGGGGVFLVGRLLGLGRKKEPLTQEVVEPVPRGDEALAGPERPGRVVYPGPRGRIVRAYVGFAAEAGRMGWKRRPDQTPRELAVDLGQPAGPVVELTELFMRARYGGEEPTDAEARVAEGAAAGAVAALRQARGPRRRAS